MSTYEPTEEELKELGFREDFTTAESPPGNYGIRLDTIDGHNEIIYTKGGHFVLDIYS